MRIISNIFPQIYQNLKSSTLDQLKTLGQTKRIAIIAAAIFACIVISYWICKSFSHVLVLRPVSPATPVNLKTEIECAKTEILQRLALDDSDFNDTEAAKIFLIINHGEKSFLSGKILPQDVNVKHILEQLDFLIEEGQKEILFDPIHPTQVKIGILAKNIVRATPPLFYEAIGEINVHKEKISCSGTTIYSNTTELGAFFELMEIDQTPVLDAAGKFI